MEYLLLGPFEVRDGDRPLQLGGSKRRALLALLVLNANEVVATDRLADELWGANAPHNASASIHNHVSRLRKELGNDVLATHRWGYVLRADPAEIDVLRFERAFAAAEAMPARERAQALAQALELWRGPTLADLTFEPALTAHIARLEERRLAALEQRLDADLEAGRAGDLIAELEMLVAAQPLREHFRWQLILALYRSGRQAEALEVYRETRRVLSEELGLEPGPELRELERAVLRQDPALAVSPVAAEGVPERTRRARRRAQAAVAACLCAAGLAAALYLIAGEGHAARHRPDATGRRPQTTARLGTTQPVSDVSKHRAAAKRKAKHVAAHSLAPSVVTTTVAAPTPATAPTTTSAKPPPKPKPAKHKRTTPIVAPAVTTTTQQQPTTTLAAPKPVPAIPTLDDPRTWWVGNPNPQEITVTQANGAVTFDVSGDAGNGFSTSLNTRCKASGDFDTSVHFTLLEWPGADGVWVSLFATDLGGVNTYRTDAFGEVYGFYVPPPNRPNQPPLIPAAGNDGYLRLTRVGSTFTGSYSTDGTNWTAIGSEQGPTAPTGIDLGVFNGDVATFADEPVRVRFDSFTLNAPSLTC